MGKLDCNDPKKYQTSNEEKTPPPNRKLISKIDRYKANVGSILRSNSDVEVLINTERGNENDDDVLLITDDTHNKTMNGELFRESVFSLVFSTLGLIGAGYLLDKIQHLDVFTKVSELIMLIPVLLNLKGNLELNFSLRLSTAVRLSIVSYLI